MLKILHYFLVYIFIVVVVVRWFRPLKIIWALSWKNLFLPYANNKGADQPDQHLCCSLLRQYNICSCCVLNFKTIASLCGCAGRFESYLVANPKTGFLVTRLISFLLSQAHLLCLFDLWFYVPVNIDSTKVMLRLSVNLTTLFLGWLPKRLTSTKCTSFHQ